MSTDWNRNFVNDYFLKTKFPNNERAWNKWKLLSDEEKSNLYAKKSEDNARKILIEFHEFSEKEANEFIDKMKREMKLQAFK